MKPITYLILIVSVALLLSCASVPPPELINARQAYEQAINGKAAQLVPAELHKAYAALAIAEKSFKDDPKSFKTRDLAYVADRKAKMAEALAVTAAEKTSIAKANKDYQATQTEIVKNTKEDLAASERTSDLKTEQIAAEQTARISAENKTAEEQKARADAEKKTAEAQKAQLNAENRAAKSQADLAKLAAVKEEARGLVITLSGSVLFASNKSTLLPSAQDRLNQVAEALMETKERMLTVEGHTDSQGTNDYNQELSQRRADAVRSYIISRGYPSDLIQANGIGEDRPVAENTNAEGRANNRRVEIVVERNHLMGSDK